MKLNEILALNLAVIFGVVLVVRYRLALPLNRIVSGLQGSAATLETSVAAGSQNSQSLAEGASEQAASLEETSASLEEIAGMTKRNAENALSAKDLSAETRSAAETGSANMQEMNRAMGDIQSAR